MVTPTPTALPFTAAMSGVRALASAGSSGLASSGRGASLELPTAAKSAKSFPAVNISPFALSKMQRTSGSLSALVISVANVLYIARVNAFFLSGRFKVRISSLSVLSTKTWSTTGISFAPYDAGLCRQHNIRMMTRWLLLLHRYLGIGLGLLMVMWCLSGLVMMYVSYPALPETARIEQLAPIAWKGCCRFPNAPDNARSWAGAQIEMLAGRPTLYLEDQSRPVDLLSGAEVAGISVAQAAQVAARFPAAATRGASPRLLGLIDHDQWTVSGEFRRFRPLFRFALED